MILLPVSADENSKEPVGAGARYVIKVVRLTHLSCDDLVHMLFVFRHITGAPP